MGKHVQLRTFYGVTKIAVVTIVCLFCLNVHLGAQVQTQNPVYKKVSKYINGYYESLPVNYFKDDSKKFPLIIFIHGKGECGNGSKYILPRVLRHGIPKLINERRFPVSVAANGTAHSFIVISPQIIVNAYNKSGSFISELLEHCKKYYRVDEERIYITGLSMGGGMTWKAVGANPEDFAAAVPICGSVVSTTAEAKAIAKAKLPIWATHNDGDPVVSVRVTKGWGTKLVASKATPAARISIFKAAGHDAWSRSYDPGFTSEGKNIYQWMLGFKRTKLEPVADAGPDQTLVLPDRVTWLDGRGSTAPYGDIKSYRWTRIKGPGKVSIRSAKRSTTKVTGLKEGTHHFRLTITDNRNVTAVDDVIITVTPAAIVSEVKADAGADQSITLPVNYIALNGSKSISSGGSITSYEWKQISGNQAVIGNSKSAHAAVGNLVAGNYAFVLTVTDNTQSSASDTVLVTVKTAPGMPVAVAGADQIVTLPVNRVVLNGYRSKATTGRIITYEWKKVSGGAATILRPRGGVTAVTDLREGVYTFSLRVINDKGRHATDFVTITVNSGSVSSRKAAVETDETVAGIATDLNAEIAATEEPGATSVAAYPNPFTTELNVKIKSKYNGKGTIQICDISGKLLKQEQLDKTGTPDLIKNLQLSNLPSGIYLVKVVVGKEIKEVIQVLKK